MLEGWSVEKVKRLGASAAKLLVYYHPDAPNAADQERLVADVADACRAPTCRCSSSRSWFSLVGGRATGRRGAPPGRRRDRPPPHGHRRRHPQGRVPLRRDGHRPGAWREACEELDAASAVPWVLLSGGVDEATFEAQVETACRAGASGVLVGRSVWAEAATMAPDARDAFLMTTGRERLGRLVELVDAVGHPWQERPGRLHDAPSPGDGWYRDY